MAQTEIDKDNLNKISTGEAVYSIWARSSETKKPINCRYVGETDNLQRRTKEHFGDNEDNECLKEFMQSELIKILVYEAMPGSAEQKRRIKEKEWIGKYAPKCNIQRNKVT